MKAEEKHKVSEWLKKQESELKINPSHYFDLIELIHNYHKEQLSTNEESCPHCSHALMKQVGSSDLKCVNCGITVR